MQYCLKNTKTLFLYHRHIKWMWVETRFTIICNRDVQKFTDDVTSHRITSHRHCTAICYPTMWNSSSVAPHLLLKSPCVCLKLRIDHRDLTPTDERLYLPKYIYYPNWQILNLRNVHGKYCLYTSELDGLTESRWKMEWSIIFRWKSNHWSRD